MFIHLTIYWSQLNWWRHHFILLLLWVVSDRFAEPIIREKGEETTRLKIWHLISLPKKRLIILAQFLNVTVSKRLLNSIGAVVTVLFENSDLCHVNAMPCSKWVETCLYLSIRSLSSNENKKHIFSSCQPECTNLSANGLSYLSPLFFKQRRKIKQLFFPTFYFWDRLAYFGKCYWGPCVCDHVREWKGPAEFFIS